MNFAELNPEHQQVLTIVMKAHGVCDVTNKLCITSECMPRLWKGCKHRVELEEWLSQSSSGSANK